MAPNRAAPSHRALTSNAPKIPVPKIKDLRIPLNIPNHPATPKNAVKK